MEFDGKFGVEPFVPDSVEASRKSGIESNADGRPGGCTGVPGGDANGLGGKSNDVRCVTGTCFRLRTLMDHGAEVPSANAAEICLPAVNAVVLAAWWT